MKKFSKKNNNNNILYNLQLDRDGTKRARDLLWNAVLHRAMLLLLIPEISFFIT